jgi:hypothetical protein
MKKKQESKHEKTITSHDKAFKAAERKTRLQLSQVASPGSNSLHKGMLASQTKFYNMMWHNMIGKEINSTFEKPNHIVPHHVVKVFL